MKMKEELAFLVMSAVAVSLLLFYLHLSIEDLSPKTARAIVIFRIDDPQPQWKENTLKRAANLFIDEGVPVTLGVIPKPHNRSSILNYPSFIFFLRRLTMIRRSFEVAQHGYTHLSLTKFKGSSEFGGISFEKQIDMMRKGKEILKSAGFEPRTFIPPFDTYDSNTIRAASELGFIAFSAGYSNESDPGTPIIVRGMVVINAATSITKDWKTGSVRSFQELKQAFDDIYEKGGVFVLETHYYRLDERTTSTIRELIHYMKEKDVVFMTLGEFGEGFLSGRIRKDGELWRIGG